MGWFALPGTLHKVAQVDSPCSDRSALGPFQLEIIGKYYDDPEKKQRNGHVLPELKGGWLRAGPRQKQTCLLWLSFPLV